MTNNLTARVIPCLDVNAGRVVKGVNFVDLRDAGDPVEMAAFYNQEGADELVFLDITASSDDRETIVDVVRRTADQVFIPLTVGGGVRSADDVNRLVKFRVGQVFLHKRYGYYAVIIGWDHKCRAADEWIAQMDIDRLPGGRNQSFYKVL